MSFGSKVCSLITPAGQRTMCIYRKMATSCHISSFSDDNSNILSMILLRHRMMVMEGQRLAVSASSNAMIACLWWATELEETGRMTRDRCSTASHIETSSDGWWVLFEYGDLEEDISS